MPFDPTKIETFAIFADRLAVAARAETLPRFRAGAVADNKAASGFDPVTDADREAERAMRELIAADFPAHGVLGEEFGAVNESAEWRWVLDPVDGTRAFVCGSATWTTLIALEHEGAAVIGVIDQPFTEERWTGFGGRTLYRRGDFAASCRTSGATDLRAARVSTTDPRADNYFSHDEAAAFADVAAVARVARFSFDAYAYGLLALGEIDLVIESGLKRHDYAALDPIIGGAGGVVSGWRGEPLAESPRGRIVAAASPGLHAAALARLAAV